MACNAVTLSYLRDSYRISLVVEAEKDATCHDYFLLIRVNTLTM